MSAFRRLIKVTDTLGIFNVYWFTTATKVTRTRLNVTFLRTLNCFVR